MSSPIAETATLFIELGDGRGQIRPRSEMRWPECTIGKLEGGTPQLQRRPSQRPRPTCRWLGAATKRWRGRAPPLRRREHRRGTYCWFRAASMWSNPEIWCANFGTGALGAVIPPARPPSRRACVSDDTTHRTRRKRRDRTRERLRVPLRPLSTLSSLSYQYIRTRLRRRDRHKQDSARLSPAQSPPSTLLDGIDGERLPRVRRSDRSYQAVPASSRMRRRPSSVSGLSSQWGMPCMDLPRSGSSRPSSRSCRECNRSDLGRMRVRHRSCG